MTKTELIKAWAQRHDIPLSKANKIADDLLGEILSAAQDGDRAISFAGLGSFKGTTTKARKGRNPATGGDIDIPAKRTVKFKLAENMVKVL